MWLGEEISERLSISQRCGWERRERLSILQMCGREKRERLNLYMGRLKKR